MQRYAFFTTLVSRQAIYVYLQRFFCMNLQYLKYGMRLGVVSVALSVLAACGVHKNNVVSSLGDSVSVAINVDTSELDRITQQPKQQAMAHVAPMADFVVKGRVLDGGGNPLSGLQVLLVNGDIDPYHLPDTDYWKERLRAISDTTDTQGLFGLKGSGRPWDNVRVLVRDIDGEVNGLFDSKLVDIHFNGSQSDSNQPVSSWSIEPRIGEVTIILQLSE